MLESDRLAQLMGGLEVTPQWMGTRLLSDYVLTVSVSVSSGVQALYSAFPAIRDAAVPLIALSILLSVLTIVFLLAVVTLQPFAIYSQAPQTVHLEETIL